jgi:hypothetical protein
MKAIWSTRALLLTVWVCACSNPAGQPMTTQDVEGTYRLELPSGTDELLVRADHQYQQRFTPKVGTVYLSAWSEWSLGEGQHLHFHNFHDYFLSQGRLLGDVGMIAEGRRQPNLVREPDTNVVYRYTGPLPAASR